MQSTRLARPAMNVVNGRDVSQKGIVQDVPRLWSDDDDSAVGGS